MEGTEIAEMKGVQDRSMWLQKIDKTKIKYSPGRESNLCIHYPFTSHNFCQKQNLKARSRFSVNVEG